MKLKNHYVFRDLAIGGILQMSEMSGVVRCFVLKTIRRTFHKNPRRGFICPMVSISRLEKEVQTCPLWPPRMYLYCESYRLALGATNSAEYVQNLKHGLDFIRQNRCAPSGLQDVKWKAFETLKTNFKGVLKAQRCGTRCTLNTPQRVESFKPLALLTITKQQNGNTSVFITDMNKFKTIRRNNV